MPRDSEHPLEEILADPKGGFEAAPGSESSSEPPVQPQSEPISQMSVEQWLESLRRNDRTFYNMMAMEVWSIAKSMDTLVPGFWSRFMENRQKDVKSFVTTRRNAKSGLRLEDLEESPTAEPEHHEPD